MAPDGGASAILPYLGGFRRATDMILSNRIVAAAEAEQIGLLTKMVPDDARAAEAKNLPPFSDAGAPLALSAATRSLWNEIEGGRAWPDEARHAYSLSPNAERAQRRAADVATRENGS